MPPDGKVPAYLVFPPQLTQSDSMGILISLSPRSCQVDININNHEMISQATSKSMDLISNSITKMWAVKATTLLRKQAEAPANLCRQFLSSVSYGLDL